MRVPQSAVLVWLRAEHAATYCSPRFVANTVARLQTQKGRQDPIILPPLTNARYAVRLEDYDLGTYRQRVIEPLGVFELESHTAVRRPRAQVGEDDIAVLLAAIVLVAHAVEHQLALGIKDDAVIAAIGVLLTVEDILLVLYGVASRRRWA